jgi:hypothetical protein
MTRFDVLDPTRRDDPRFDPHGAQARRVRARAVARAEATASRPGGRRVLARVALAACVVAILAVAASVLLTTSSPPNARAALQQAAARTASFDSGRVIYTYRAEPRGREPGYVARLEVRFDDDGDLEGVLRSRRVFPGGRTVSMGAETFRDVDGRGYSRDDSRPGAGWVPEGQAADKDHPHRLVDQVGSVALVALARRASDLTTQPAAGWGTVYRATATAGEVFDAAPTATARASGGGWKRKVQLAVTVDDDGVIRHVEVSSPQATQTTEYVDLGEPQVIERPPPDTRADGR